MNHRSARVWSAARGSRQGLPTHPIAPRPPLRILFATSHAYLPQRVGGSQQSTHDLCVELAAAGHEPAVLCSLKMYPHKGRDWTHVRNRLLSRITRHSHPCDQRRPYRVYRGYGTVNGVREVTGAFRPDLAIVQSGTPVPLVVALLEENVRTILYFRDVEFDTLGGPVPSDPRLRFVANSKFTASRVKRELGLEAVVIEPLVRPSAYRTVTRGRHVLFVNPLEKKGLRTAIALARLNPDIPFVFLESWPMTGRQFGELQRAVCLLPNVVLRRATLRMAREYAQARILLVPSVWQEAWGRVVTEAQCSGIPVIASAVGGLPESVGRGGVLVPPDASIDEWHARLRELWTSPAVYAHYQQRALEHARREEIRPATLLRRLLSVAVWDPGDLPQVVV